MLAVERNNHGHAVLLKVDELGYTSPMRELYYHDDEKPGWPTTPLTRPVMLAELREAVNEDYMKVRDRHFLRECTTFKKQKNGKFEAKRPDTDDTIFKWGIAWQVRDKVRGPMRIERW
jgi:hypothetical protein